MLLTDSQLKEFLLDADLITKSDLSSVEAEAQKKNMNLPVALVSSGRVSSDDLRKIEAHALGVPFVSLQTRVIDSHVLALVPEPLARKHNIIAYQKNGNRVEVALLDLGELSRVAFLYEKEGLQILPRLTDRHSIVSALREYHKHLHTEFGSMIERELNTFKEAGFVEGPVEDLKNNPSARRLVDVLLQHALKSKASQVHLEPTQDFLLVRYRIGSLLHEALRLPLWASVLIAAHLKILAHLNINETRVPQEGRFEVESGEATVTIRVSVVPVHTGEKIVLRVLEEGARGFSLEALGFQGEGLELVHNALNMSKGVIVIAGPAHSGKTTLLYSLLDFLNVPGKVVATIENTIELNLSGINQTKIRPELGFSFAEGLRALLRQDSDVVAVGELVDQETGSVLQGGVRAGKMIIAVCDAPDTVSAAKKILQFSPALPDSAPLYIISTKVLRKLSSQKEKYFLTTENLTHFEKSADLKKILALLKKEGVVPPEASWRSIPFYRPRSTTSLSERYKGFTGIFEILRVDPPLRQLAVTEVSEKVFLKRAEEEGLSTFLESGIRRAISGDTSLEEVFGVLRGI